jgi:hypothetical protein
MRGIPARCCHPAGTRQFSQPRVVNDCTAFGQKRQMKDNP